MSSCLPSVLWFVKQSGAHYVAAALVVLCVVARCRDAWHALQSSRDPQVLCEVVSCLPRLMAALGPVLTHRELLPALAALLQSHLTWVAGQLVHVMADLLQQLPPSGHEMLLKVIMALLSCLCTVVQAACAACVWQCAPLLSRLVGCACLCFACCPVGALEFINACILTCLSLCAADHSAAGRDVC